LAAAVVCAAYSGCAAVGCGRSVCSVCSACAAVVCAVGSCSACSARLKLSRSAGRTVVSLRRRSRVSERDPTAGRFWSGWPGRFPQYLMRAMLVWATARAAGGRRCDHHGPRRARGVVDAKGCEQRGRGRRAGRTRRLPPPPAPVSLAPRAPAARALACSASSTGVLTSMAAEEGVGDVEDLAEGGRGRRWRGRAMLASTAAREGAEHRADDRRCRALEAGADLGDLDRRWSGGCRSGSRTSGKGPREARSPSTADAADEAQHAALRGDAAVEAGGLAVEDALAGHRGGDDLVEGGVLDRARAARARP
jgi:hypothetical protein